MCILVVVDRFSKSCRLIPLKNLPTAMETAEQIFNHVFRYFGIPEDIVSDRGPQLFPEYGRTLSRKLVVSCEPSAMPTSTLGTSLLAGPSTPRTRFVNKPLDSLPSSACSISSHLCSPGTGNYQMYLQ